MREISANNFNVNENDCQLDLVKNLFYSLMQQSGMLLTCLRPIVIWRTVWVEFANGR